MNTHRADVAVVGAGIVGLAHAWSAAKRGYSVVLFERSRQAQGASIRNFGMIWPIGQTSGRNYGLALRSRQLWRELGEVAGVWQNHCGSIHLALHEDELAVLSEFAELAPSLGYQVELLSSAEVRQRSPAANGRHVLGGLFSSTEIGVNPRQALSRIPQWLQQTYGVDVQFGTLVNRIDMPMVSTADGRCWEVGRAIVCGGAEFQILFPEIFATSGIRTCKLQMMQTVAQSEGWQIGPMLASGLTLRHYPTFRVCPSLARMKQRVAAEYPAYDRYGIHALVSQTDTGEVILGDSHEYDEEIDPFDKQEINELILGYLRQMIQLKDWRIAHRWHGIYAKHPTEIEFTAQVQPNCHIVTATGGTGMTMSFGLAEEHWSQWANQSPHPGRQTTEATPDNGAAANGHRQLTADQIRSQESHSPR